MASAFGMKQLTIRNSCKVLTSITFNHGPVFPDRVSGTRYKIRPGTISNAKP